MSKDYALEESSVEDMKEIEDEEEPKNSDSHNNCEENYCRTPTRQEQKIPRIQSCPPAPRKPKAVGLRKRKLWAELEFFEDKEREEVESFFRSCSQFSRVSLGTATAKKRLITCREPS